MRGKNAPGPCHSFIRIVNAWNALIQNSICYMNHPVLFSVTWCYWESYFIFETNSAVMCLLYLWQRLQHKVELWSSNGMSYNQRYHLPNISKSDVDKTVHCISLKWWQYKNRTETFLWPNYLPLIVVSRMPQCTAVTFCEYLYPQSSRGWTYIQRNHDSNVALNSTDM